MISHSLSSAQLDSIITEFKTNRDAARRDGDFSAEFAWQNAIDHIEAKRSAAFTARTQKRVTSITRRLALH